MSLRRSGPQAVVVAALLIAAGALAVVALAGRTAPTEREQAHQIASALHCPVCKDLSAADSPAPLARQMRQQIRRQLAAGATPAEIREGFVAAYGQDVLMSPPHQGWGRVVHLAPFVVVAGAVLVGGLLVRRGIRSGADRGAGTTSRRPLLRQLQDLDDDLAAGRVQEAEHRRLRAALERESAEATSPQEAHDERRPVPLSTGARRGVGLLVAVGAAVGVVTLLVSALEPRTPPATAADGAASADARTTPSRSVTAEADAQRLADVEAAVADVKAHPGQASAHVELARAYTAVEQPQLAVVEYLAATRLDPANGEANSALALVAFKAGSARQADALVSKALAAHPAHPEALYTRGLIRAMGLHHPAAATRDLRAYLREAPLGAHRRTVATVLALLDSGAIK